MCWPPGSRACWRAERASCQSKVRSLECWGARRGRSGRGGGGVCVEERCVSRCDVLCACVMCGDVCGGLSLRGVVACEVQARGDNRRGRRVSYNFAGVKSSYNFATTRRARRMQQRHYGGTWKHKQQIRCDWAAAYSRSMRTAPTRCVASRGVTPYERESDAVRAIMSRANSLSQRGSGDGSAPFCISM